MRSLPERFVSALADRFVVEREIGRGGMASVWLAHDVRHGRSVALKTIEAGSGDETATDRFSREIAIVARLVHPHILPLFDSGVAEGRAWFVMPFIDGESLRDRLRRKERLAPDEALRLARDGWMWYVRLDPRIQPCADLPEARAVISSVPGSALPAQ